MRTEAENYIDSTKALITRLLSQPQKGTAKTPAAPLALILTLLL